MRARPHQIHEARGLRMVAIHERLHEQAVVALGQIKGGPHVGRAPAERLLAQHVLAGLERPARPLQVQRVGERDVDGLDVGVGQQRLVAVIGALDAPLRRVVLGADVVAAGDGQHRGLLRLRHPGDELVVDPGRGQNAPLHGHVARVGAIGQTLRSAAVAAVAGLAAVPAWPPWRPWPACRPRRFPVAPRGWASRRRSCCAYRGSPGRWRARPRGGAWAQARVAPRREQRADGRARECCR